MIEKLSFKCVRHSNSSTVGLRKNGCPNRNVVANPIAVSAGTFEVIAERGRNSRVYEKCASFNNVGEIVEIDELVFEVIEVERRRVSKLRVRKRPETAAEG